MKIMLSRDARAFAEDALDAMHDTAYREWDPEPAEHYSRIASAMAHEPWNAVELSEADASRIVFAVLAYKAFGHARDALLESLRSAFGLPRKALSLQALSRMEGKPVYVPSMRGWALVGLCRESRQHDPLPHLKGLEFDIDPIARGTLCVRSFDEA